MHELMNTMTMVKSWKAFVKLMPLTDKLNNKKYIWLEIQQIKKQNDTIAKVFKMFLLARAIEELCLSLEFPAASGATRLRKATIILEYSNIIRTRGMKNWTQIVNTPTACCVKAFGQIVYMVH